MPELNWKHVFFPSAPSTTYSFIDLKIHLVAILLEVFLVKVFSLEMCFFFFFEKLRLRASPESTTSDTSDSSYDFSDF